MDIYEYCAMTVTLIICQEYLSPFAELPGSLLEDFSQVIYEKRAGLKHLLHPVRKEE